MATVERVLGKAIKRREDPRFITGKGNYVDDVKLPGATWAAFVRSPHASARIRSIDTSKAKQHPGVVAVYTGADMTGVNSLPCGWDLRKEKKIPGVVQDLAMVPHMPLSSDAARHVGDPVAVVIAETQSAATDAAEKVVVDWDVQKSVTDTQRATTAGAPQVHAGAPGNVAFKWELGDAAATEAAIKGAAVTVKKRIINQRLVANAMEPRACAARYDDATGELDAVGDLAESARAPAADVRLRPRHPRAQGPGHRARRGRRLRLQDLPLQRGGRVLVGVPAAQAAGALDVVAARGVPDRRARSRPRHRRRDGHVGRRQDPRAPRQDRREPGRVSVHVRAGGADVPLRHAAQRRVHDRGDPRLGDRCLQQHHRGRRLSRRRAAGSRLRAGADGGSRPRPRSRWTCSRCAGRTSFRSSRARTRRTWPCRTTAATMQARSTS